MSPEAPRRVFSMIEAQLEEVVPNPRNPRFAPSKTQIRRLASSIKASGQRTPHLRPPAFGRAGTFPRGSLTQVSGVHRSSSFLLRQAFLTRRFDPSPA
jgi:hypothetical protein